MQISKYIRETPKVTEKVEKLKEYISKGHCKLEEACKLLSATDGTALALESPLLQIGLLSVVIIGMERGTFKVKIDCLTQHLSCFFIHALKGPGSEMFQKDIIKDVIYSLLDSCVQSFRKLKITSAALRPLRLFLSEWYPPFVATHLHSIFAEIAIQTKAYHYAYPLMKHRALKSIAKNKIQVQILLEYNYNRGLILLRNGDYERALQAFAIALNSPLDMPSFLFRIPGYVLQSYIYVQILCLYLNKKPEFVHKLCKQDHQVIFFFRKEIETLGDALAERNVAKLKLYRDRDEKVLRKRDLKGIIDHTIEKLEEEEALTLLKCFNKVSLKEFQEEMKKNEIEGGRILNQFQKQGIFTLDQKTSQLKIRSTEKTEAKILKETVADVSECLNNAKQILLGLSVQVQMKAGAKIQKKK